MALNCHPRAGMLASSVAAAAPPSEMYAAPILSPPTVIGNHRKRHTNKLTTPIIRCGAMNDGISAVASDPAQVEVGWQIVVGALAGVAPFVVAGTEFSKRIAEQRRCKVCKGSGLVLRDNKYYFRCPACGGFLPWQSWRRFFTS